MKRKRFNKKRIIISVSIVVIVLFVFSQTYGSIIKLLWGIHEPRVETTASILKAASRYELNKGSIVTVSPDGFSTIMNDFHHGIPEGMIFDRQGQYIEYKLTDSACNAGLFGFIPSLNAAKKYNSKSELTLNREMAMLRTIEGAALPAGYIDTTADFYLLISWASFTGRLNKDHVKKWQELAKSNAKAKLQVVLVNVDVQQWWPQPARNNILASFSFKN